jgi:hypothetical protein
MIYTIEELSKFFIDNNIDFLSQIKNFGYSEGDFVDIMDIIQIILDIEKDYNIGVSDGVMNLLIDKEYSIIKSYFINEVRDKKLNELGI